MDIVYCAVGALGLLAGIMVGMSKSAIGGAVAGGVLTFAGSTVVAASIRDGITPAQLDRLGDESLILVVGVALGLAIGLILQRYGPGLPLKRQ